MCAGTAADERMTSRVIAESAATASSPAQSPLSTRENMISSAGAPRSIPGRCANSVEDVGRLREDGFFERRAVRDRRVECANAADGCVEMLEQIARDARSNFRTE